MPSLPNNMSPYVLLGGENVESSMPRLLVKVAGTIGQDVTVIDANNDIFMMVTDMSTIPPTIVYYVFGTTTIGTPVAPINPYEYIAGIVSTPDLTTIESDVTASANVTSAADLVIQMVNKSTLSFITTGTWTGTIAISGSIDGVTYNNLGYFNRTTGLNGTTFTSNVSGQTNIIGLKYVKFSGVATGTMIINYTVSRVSTVNNSIVGSINGGTP